MKIFQCLEKPAGKVPTSGKSVRGGLLQDAVQHLAYELLFAAWQLADDFELTLDLRLGSALSRGPVIGLQNVRPGKIGVSPKDWGQPLTIDKAA